MLLRCHGNRWRHAGPLWMGAPLVHSSSPLDWLAGKLHGAAMATDWSYAERGLLAATARWGPSRQFSLPSFRKLDWLWWGLDLGRAPSITLHLECFWNNRLTLRHQSTCVREYILFACWTNKKQGEIDAICQPYTKLGYPLVGWH